MNLKIIRFENQLMSSNTYIIVDDNSKSCIVIDPGDIKAERVRKYINEHLVEVDYIILTHTHPDHCLGANTLKRIYPNVPVVYHDDKFKEREFILFFRLIQDDDECSFKLVPSDIDLQEDTIINWHGHIIKIIMTPGHSAGSICVDIDNVLYTGDTMIPFPPFFNGRGSNKEEWRRSVIRIYETYSGDTIIYPGHGEALTMGSWNENYFFQIINNQIHAQFR